MMNYHTHLDHNPIQNMKSEDDRCTPSSFALLGVANQLSRKNIFNILRPFGEVTFLQVSRISAKTHNGLSFGEAYVTFSHLSVPFAFLTSKLICAGMFGNESLMSVLSKLVYLKIAKNRIFVKKLPKNTTKEELLEFFGEFGKVQNLVIPGKNSTRALRGFAMIEMQKYRCSKMIVKECRRGLHFKKKLIEANFFDPFENEGRIYNHNLPSNHELLPENSSSQEFFPSSNYRFNIKSPRTTATINTSSAIESGLGGLQFNSGNNDPSKVIHIDPKAGQPLGHLFNQQSLCFYPGYEFGQDTNQNRSLILMGWIAPQRNIRLHSESGY